MKLLMLLAKPLEPIAKSLQLKTPAMTLPPANLPLLLQKPSTRSGVAAAAARAAATEVLGTHKGLKGADLKEYVATYFPRTWAHFDVNKAGEIGVEVLPQFMRFISSNEKLSLQ